VIAAPLYSVLKFFHVLAAVTWVGGSITAQILATRVVRGGTPEERYALFGEFDSSEPGSTFRLRSCWSYLGCGW
jgi:hypothetical protein